MMIDFSPNTEPYYLTQELKCKQVLEYRISASSKPYRYAFVGSTNSKVSIIPVSDRIWNSEFRIDEKGISFQDLGKVTKMVLGHEGVDRLNKFRQYEAGWNFGEGLSLSSKSLSTMEYFIDQSFSFKVSPSIFMSNEGNLLLGWEDNAGKKIELEFQDESIGYFIESLDEENEIVLDRKQIEALVNKLHQI